ncbi:uncharacterized protein LOC112134718 [Pongo abelii]|uniref:uncharacterized protein LOC112134718 n=1 Tax=Pongo abelii TaxID=9601 RepID=UPI003007197E
MSIVLTTRTKKKRKQLIAKQNFRKDTGLNQLVLPQLPRTLSRQERWQSRQSLPPGGRKESQPTREASSGSQKRRGTGKRKKTFSASLSSLLCCKLKEDRPPGFLEGVCLHSRRELYVCKMNT